MSTSPMSKDDLATFYERTLREIEEEERLGHAEPFEPEPTMAELALSANAGAWGERVKVIARPDLQPIAGGDHLERDGSQFILVSCAFMERIGVPPDARDFALWMEGIANGNFSEPFRATDEQIAAVYGYSTRTVELKRAALMAWQDDKDACLVQVTEKKFNRETGKNDPTEYTVHVGRHVSDFIRKARDNKAFRRNPVRSVEQPQASGLFEIIEETKNDIQPDLSVRRDADKEPQPPKEDKVVKAGDYLRRLRSLATKFSDNEYELGNDPVESMRVASAEMELIASKARTRVEARMAKGARKDFKTSKSFK